jgi:hypothetical protein
MPPRELAHWNQNDCKRVGFLVCFNKRFQRDGAHWAIATGLPAAFTWRNDCAADTTFKPRTAPSRDRKRERYPL